MRAAGAWTLRRFRELADPLVVRAVSGVPPRRLRARTGAPGARDFAVGGQLAARELSAALPGPVASASRVLDFGCGSGRVLPHVVALAPGVRGAGCDVDAEAIAWASRHHPQLDWRVSRFTPPLPFEAATFELVYSISVFSHLDEDLQDRWLTELARVLRPDGIALLSVHGPHAFGEFRAGQVSTAWCRPGAFAREPLAPEEFVFEPYVQSIWNRSDLPGVGTQYGLAFHGHDYLRRRWSRWFEIVEVRERALSEWQDLVVCRRRMS